jgi:hypothetical protein
LKLDHRCNLSELKLRFSVVWRAVERTFHFDFGAALQCFSGMPMSNLDVFLSEALPKSDASRNS